MSAPSVAASEPLFFTSPTYGIAIAYCIFGDAASQRTLLHSHGFPGSRLQAAVFHRQALAAGVRVVGVDRPGFGRSEVWPASVASDPASVLKTHWPALIKELLAEIASSASVSFSGPSGGGSVSFSGVSGGGPYALSLAMNLPNARGLILIAPSTDPTKRSTWAGMPWPNYLVVSACLNPWLRWIGVGMNSLMRYAISGRDPADIKKMLGGSFPTESDRAAFQDDEFGTAIASEMLEAFGGAGFAQGATTEACVLFSPWGLSPSDLNKGLAEGDPGFVRAAVFAGAEDTACPLAAVRESYFVIGGADAVVKDGLGHMAVYKAVVDEAEGLFAKYV
ncbi:Alpha/Beta hydrolase protein [Hyaloraphidium curvatum]|nr:Alpha/Beta hydrolase protein [Hyaloraphidium curvatum]